MSGVAVPTWRRVGASVLMVGLTIGWWSIWARWLTQPVVEPPHRLLIPFGWAAVTVWVLGEWAVRLLEPFRRRQAPVAVHGQVLWLAVIGLAVDLWVRLTLRAPWLGMAVVLLWVLGRRVDVMARLWNLLAQSRWGVALILLLAFGLRAVFAWRLEHAGLDPAILDGPDSGYYHAAATALARGEVTWWQPHWLTYPRHNPGPLLLYAMLYRVVGPSVLAVRLVQLALSLWSCVLVYGSAKRLFGEPAARLALFLVAGHGYLIAYGSYLGTETLGLFFAALCVWWWTRLVDADRDGASPAARRLWITGSGLSASWLILTRPEYVALPFALWAWYGWRGSRQVRRAWSWVLVISLLLPLGWALRNRRVFGLWTLQAHKSLGYSEWPELAAHGFVAADTAPDIRVASAPGRVERPSRLDWRQALARPWEAMRAAGTDMAGKVRTLWSWSRYAWPPAVVYPTRDEAAVVFISGLLFAGLLLGVWQCRRAPPACGVLLVLLAAKTVVHACSIIRDWLRMTMEPFVNMLEAAGLVALGAWIAVSLTPPAPPRARPALSASDPVEPVESHARA